jgi:CO dehydrogenase/acetyl-CoA synthase alpha subunit
MWLWLLCAAADSFQNSLNHKIVSSVNHADMMEIIRKGVDSVTTVLEYCIKNTFLRQKEAMHIFSAMNKELRDPALSASKILPRMVDPVEARSFMMQASFMRKHFLIV